MKIDTSEVRPSITQGMAVWQSIRKLSRLWAAVAKSDPQVAKLGYTEFSILEALITAGEQPINKIGKSVQLTSGATTAAVDRLERAGYVKRNAHPTDRRVRLVALTTEGKGVAEQGFVVLYELAEQTVAVLDVDERQNLAVILNKLADGFNL